MFTTDEGFGALSGASVVLGRLVHDLLVLVLSSSAWSGCVDRVALSGKFLLYSLRIQAFLGQLPFVLRGFIAGFHAHTAVSDAGVWAVCY